MMVSNRIGYEFLLSGGMKAHSVVQFAELLSNLIQGSVDRTSDLRV